jgi:hypothetical protein
MRATMWRLGADGAAMLTAELGLDEMRWPPCAPQVI